MTACCPLSLPLPLPLPAEFVGAWEDVKAEEQRRAAEEAEVFKQKTRTTDIASEEQEDEEDYQRAFPDRFAGFADLAPEEQPDTLAGDSEAAAANAATAAAAAAGVAGGPGGEEGEEQLQGAAALSARDLVLGEVLQDLVAVHASSFAADTSGSSAPNSSGSSGAAADFLRSYELGVQLLRAAGLVLPAALDTATGSGHLYAACCRFRQLAQAPASIAAAAATGVDIQAACIEEAVLVQQPVLALRQRLLALLEEWPEHPGLLQVRCFCDCPAARRPLLPQMLQALHYAAPAANKSPCCRPLSRCFLLPLSPLPACPAAVGGD